VFEGSLDPICTDERCEFAAFFPDLTLGYAETLLYGSEEDEERIVIISRHMRGTVEKLSNYDLRARTVALACTLRELGVEPGDRIVAVSHNSWEAVVGALSAAAVGASFSTASPDMGTPAILSRFAPLSPKILMAHTQAVDHRERHTLVDRIVDVASCLPTLKAFITFDEPTRHIDIGIRTLLLPDILAFQLLDFSVIRNRYSFNHPLFILFSSGTLGSQNVSYMESGEHFLNMSKSIAFMST